MANETKLSSWGAGSGRLTEVLSAVPLPADLPKIVALPLVNADSIAGAPSSTKSYGKLADLGAATAGTEGTDFTTNTELTYDTAVTVTPVESAVVKSVITDQAIERLFPGNASATQVVQNADPAAVLQALGPHAQQHMAMCLEKAETDLCALFDALSVSVGATTVDLSIANMLSAIYSLSIADVTNEEAAFVLSPQQVADLRTAVAAANFAVWFNQGDLSFFNQNSDMSRTGFRGTFMGRPVYEISASTKETINAGADDSGAYMSIANGASPESGPLSPFVYCEGRSGFTHYAEIDASLRAVELVTVLSYAIAEIKDSHGISIVSDAP